VIWHPFQQRLQRHFGQGQFLALLTSTGIAGWVLVFKLAGFFQQPDLMVLNQFFNWRPREGTDSRIVIVTIGEEDIRRAGRWPLPDRRMAQLLQAIAAQQPRVIGFDVYRDLPVDPGHAQLSSSFETIPNLIGIEKLVGDRVDPPPSLPRNRIGFDDLVPDVDGEIRRGLISLKREGDSEISLAFVIQVALSYLQAEGLGLRELKPYQYQLGKATFHPLQANDGGYVNADVGGYQMLLNFRGTEQQFQTRSMTDVLSGRISAQELHDLMHDRVVLIGSTAESLRDIFQTPYGKMPGVVVHANFLSQILNGAMEGRLFLYPCPELMEWLTVWLGAWLGTSLAGWLLQISILNRVIIPYLTQVGIGVDLTGIGIGVMATGLASGLMLSSYAAFLMGWWIPAIAPLAALTAGAVVGSGIYSQKLKRWADLDGLTLAANRRYFDDFLAKKISERGRVALIFCDVDHFKAYNDTYGHQAGDECLKEIVNAIRLVIRRSDLVARYGGEEFAVVLPNTTVEEAEQIAERIIDQVRNLRISHRTSSTCAYVTLSCGVAGMVTGTGADGMNLVFRADEALYLSKAKGRDRFTIAP